MARRVSGTPFPGTIARLQTNTKVIVIVTLALLPLGIIALMASLQASRSADDERRAELGIAATEASRRLATQFAGDIDIVRRGLRDLEGGSDAAAVCTRTGAMLRASNRGVARGALYTVSTSPICATPGFAPPRPALPLTPTGPDVRLVGDSIMIVVPTVGGTGVAVLHYPANALGALVRPTGAIGVYRMTLEVDGAQLPIGRNVADELSGRTDSISVPVGLDALALSMTVNRVPFGAVEAILTFLPLLMWAAAATVGYFVVDRMLIRPLKALRTAVETYEPGSSRRVLAQTPAIEIRELEDSFSDYADRLAAREHEVEAALAAQVRLTREVHHRVKNNLQVIASLINLHARDAQSDDARAAYVRIQRRVDALAIVHRNHFAELEANQGIDGRGLMSELVSNFRASVAREKPMAITLAAAPVLLGQDVAMPLAFLFTELAEIALGGSGPIDVSLSATDGGATFAVAASGLPAPGSGNPAFRIIEGLARQLRSPLNHDATLNRYTISVPVLDAAHP